MRKHRKPFKFYLYMFLFAIVLVIIYTLYNIIRGTVDYNELIITWLLPFIFVGFYYGSDTLMDKLTKKKEKVDYEDKFLDRISEAMRNSNEFLIEDFRKLQLNEKFQKAVQDAYNVYQNGENELYNLQRIEKKFKKDTIEHKAILFVLSYIKESQKKGETE